MVDNALEMLLAVVRNKWVCEEQLFLCRVFLNVSGVTAVRMLCFALALVSLLVVVVLLLLLLLLRLVCGGGIAGTGIADDGVCGGGICSNGCRGLCAFIGVLGQHWPLLRYDVIVAPRWIISLEERS